VKGYKEGRRRRDNKKERKKEGKKERIGAHLTSALK
jgi:hypothetical protein